MGTHKGIPFSHGIKWLPDSLPFLNERFLRGNGQKQTDTVWYSQSVLSGSMHVPKPGHVPLLRRLHWFWFGSHWRQNEHLCGWYGGGGRMVEANR